MWLFLVSVLMACAGTGVSSSCALEITPPEAVVRFGDPLLANCTSLSKQVEEMGWESPYGGVALTAGVTSLLLNISSVKDWELRPNCFMNVLGGDQCMYSLPVTIYKTPDNVSISQPSEIGPLVEGQTYGIRCDIVNVAPVRNLSLYCYKGDDVVFTRTFDDIRVGPVNQSAVVKLMAHRDDHGTEIWCEAKMNFLPGPDVPSILSQRHELNVLYPPTFIKPAAEVLDIPADRKIILNCTATGNPVPVYSWQFLNPLTLLRENLTTNQPIYIPDDPLTGTYNCTASNSRGTRTKCFTVNEAARDRTIFAALVGVLVALGVLLLVGGLCFVTPEGSFSCSKGSYMPTSSGPE